MRELPLNRFQRLKKAKDGYNGRCSECISARRFAWMQGATRETQRDKAVIRREATREEARVRERTRYQLEGDRIRARNNAWHHSNKEMRSLYNFIWRCENPERVAGYNTTPATRAKIAKRRAALLRAIPPWADFGAIRAVYEECVARVQSTGVPHHVDHVVPLQSPIVSGLHVHYNLEVVPAVDNLAKGNKLMETAHV